MNNTGGQTMNNTGGQIMNDTGEKEPMDLVFIKRMAALYNKDSYDGRDRVLEMNFTDLGKSYQILLGKEGSQIYTDGSRTTTTCINTPFKVWTAIARGEIEHADAIGKLYTVTGDFSFMMKWNEYFGSPVKKDEEDTTDDNGKPKLKDPQMKTMIIVWTAFWIAVSIDTFYGSIATLAICVLMPVVRREYRFVKWDWISICVVSVLSVIALISGNGNIVIDVGYLIFGLMWLVSCLMKEPLCATYVKYRYGGDRALKNPLFMKTNYILAILWGVLYVLLAIWTYFLRAAGFGNLLIIINNGITILMAFFTVWFQKWYPAWLASGKGRKL